MAEYEVVVDAGTFRSAAPDATSGGFDTDRWSSTGITYVIEVDSSATPDEVDRLIARVDEVAEIPRAIRAGADVSRGPAPADR